MHSKPECILVSVKSRAPPSTSQMNSLASNAFEARMNSLASNAFEARMHSGFGEFKGPPFNLTNEFIGFECIRSQNAF